MNIVELTRKLAAIDSSISHGTCDIVNYAVELCNRWSLNFEVVPETINGIHNANLIIRPDENASNEDLLFISHLDTSDPGEYGRWVRTGANPFNASLDGDSIYGLGIANAKADFACKLIAFKEGQEAKRKNNKTSVLNPVLVSTFGLSSGFGAIRLIRKKKVNPKAVIVSGPTNLEIANRGPGYAKVEVTIPFSHEEKEYHDRHNFSEVSVSQSKVFSRPNSERISLDFFDNPIIKLIDYLKNLPTGISVLSIDGGANAETEPDMAYLELNIVDGIQQGVISKLIKIGEALKDLSVDFKKIPQLANVEVPSKIILGSVRTHPEEIKLSGVCKLAPVGKEDLYSVWIEKLRTACKNTGADFKIIDFKEPFITDEKSHFVSSLKEISSSLNLPSALRSAHECTEANIYSRMNKDTIVYGAGELKGLKHSSEESVTVQQLEHATAFYRKTLERYCI